MGKYGYDEGSGRGDFDFGAANDFYNPDYSAQLKAGMEAAHAMYVDEVSRRFPGAERFIGTQYQNVLDAAMRGDTASAAWLSTMSAMGGGGGGGRGGGGGGGGGGGESPDSRARRTNQMHAELNNMAGIFGIGGDWGDLASQGIANNWDIEQVRDMLADHITMETANNPGLVQNVFSKVRELGSNYFLDVGDESLLGFAKQIARGELREEDLAGWAREMAKGKYAHLANIIDSGITVRQYFEPHRQEIAKLLEVAPDSIDLQHDAKWQDIVARDDGQGNIRAATLWEAGMKARASEDWKATNNAHRTVTTMATAVAKALGAMG